MSSLLFLPAGWCTETIQELCDVNPKHDPDTDRDQLVSFVPMPAVSDIEGKITNPQTRPLVEVWKGYTHFADGDVIFAKITPCMENGKAAVAEGLTNGMACGSTEFHVLRSKGGVLPAYLHRYLRQESYRFDAERAMTGAVGQRRVPKSYLEVTSLPIPPLPEQRRIVAKIEALQERSDRARGALTAIPPLLEKFRQSVLAAAFRGDLTRAWREQNPHTEPASELLKRIRQERRRRWEAAELAKMQARGQSPTSNAWKAKYQEPAHVDSTDLPELPEGWVWTTLENLAKFNANAICAGPFGTIFKAKDFRPEGVPIIFLRHVAPGQYKTQKSGFMDVNKWEEYFRPYSVFGGELLVTKLGDPPGVCAIYPTDLGPAMVTPDVIKMETNEEAARSRYLMHFLNSNESRKFAFGVAYGATRLRMNLSIFREIPVPLAPLEEQMEIERIIDIFQNSIVQVERMIQIKTDQLGSLVQSILAKAFRGELVPQDPNDEPAAVLLARIRAEREKTTAKRRTRKGE